MIKPKRNR